LIIPQESEEGVTRSQVIHGGCKCIGGLEGGDINIVLVPIPVIVVLALGGEEIDH
jgi:hypothetical protein